MYVYSFHLILLHLFGRKTSSMKYQVQDIDVAPCGRHKKWSSPPLVRNPIINDMNTDTHTTPLLYYMYVCIYAIIYAVVTLSTAEGLAPLASSSRAMSVKPSCAAMNSGVVPS